MDHAATTFQAQHHLILRRRHGQQRGDLVAQVVYCRRANIAIEIENEDSSWRLGLPVLLGRLRFALAQCLERVLLHYGLLQALTHGFVEFVELVHLEVPTTLFAAPPPHRSQRDEHDHDRHDQRDGLCQEAGIVDKKFHVSPSMSSDRRQTTFGGMPPAYRRACT